MTAKVGLAELAQLAAMMADRDLAAFGAATAARDNTRAAIARLDDTALPGDAAAGFAAYLAAERHRPWVEQRRAILRDQLARDMVVLAMAQTVAAKAFGRQQALAALSRRKT